MRYLWFLLGLAVLLCLMNPARSERAALSAARDPGVACSELFICLAAFHQDLERLRQIMGEPQASPLDIGIRNPTPRDVYFQALALWQRTQRLAFEIMRRDEQPPPAPPDNIRLDDALSLVQEAYGILKEVMVDPKIAESRIPTPQDPAEPAAHLADKTPTAAFTTLLAMNRQLNLLLERHYSPSDVYREVTLAVAYTAQLLARYPEAKRLPEEPPFEPAKQPADVYFRLMACLYSIVHVMDALGLAASQVEIQDLDKTSIAPGDVFLVASLIVAQLDFLHRHLGITQAPRQVFYPGRKFPSHVYQRAGLLQAQLVQLEQRLATKGTVSGKE